MHKTETRIMDNEFVVLCMDCDWDFIANDAGLVRQAIHMHEEETK